MAAVAAQTISKPMSMATTNSCLVSVPSIFTPSKPSTLQQTIHFKPTNKLSLRCTYSSNSLSLFFPKKKDSVFIISAQQEENPVLVSAEEEGNLNWGVGSESEETGVFSEPSEEAKVYVGNLPYDVDSENLAGIFGEAGVVEISEVIYDRETGRSRGFAFVNMSTVEEAEKAVEMFSGYDLNGRQLTVNKAAPRGSRPERTERGPRVFESASRIYVGNLPWTVDDEGLEQVFSEYGKVVSARVVSDRETGRSRGFGFVVMSSESEMTEAITNLDGQSVDGRAIRVNVAEEKPRRSRF